MNSNDKARCKCGQFMGTTHNPQCELMGPVNETNIHIWEGPESKKKMGRPSGGKNKPRDPSGRAVNITVTNPLIVKMINDYCDSLESTFGFRPNITQGLTHLFTVRLKNS